MISSLPIRILVSSHSSRPTSWYPGKEYDVGENKLTPTFPVYGRFVSRFLINEGSSERWPLEAAAPEKGSAASRGPTEIYFLRDRFTR